MSALDVLAAEVVEIERALQGRRDVAEKARTKATEARQRLDAANAEVTAQEDRLDATRTALATIADRDDVSGETVDQIIATLRGPQ